VTSLHYERADDRLVPKMWVRLFRTYPWRAAGSFLRGLLPGLLWGVGLFAAVWIVEWIIKPHWAYRNAVLAIWCGVVAAPSALYIGGVVQSIWQDRAAEAAARASELRPDKLRG
jgi:hypothetical protein